MSGSMGALALQRFARNAALRYGAGAGGATRRPAAGPHCLIAGEGLSYLRKTWKQSMAEAASLKTRVSTKGQVVLLKAVRDKRGFGPGAELIVEERPEGVLAASAQGRSDPGRGRLWHTGTRRPNRVDRGDERRRARRSEAPVAAEDP